MKNNIIIAITVLVAVVAGIIFFKTVQTDSSIEPTISYSKTPNATNPPATKSPSTSIPATLSLKVPFTPQAPTGNWDQLHNEACEEASALMATAYLNGDTRAKIPATEVETELTALTGWQQAHFGYYLDTTAEETAEMIRGFYNLDAKVVADYTEKDIKDALNANKIPIIVAAGQKLGNPNYRQPGPIYHMLVVRGYTATKIITNDPGTRNGESYLYSFATLKNASADWDHATGTIDQTKSVMIVVSK